MTRKFGWTISAVALSASLIAAGSARAQSKDVSKNFPAVPNARADSIAEVLRLQASKPQLARRKGTTGQQLDASKFSPIVDVLYATSREDYHKRVQRLPVFVHTKKAKNAKGEDGVLKEFIHRSGYAQSVFVKSVQPGALVSSRVTAALRSAASTEDQGRFAPQRPSRMMAQLCWYDDEQVPCADTTAFYDAITYEVAVTAEVQPTMDALEADIAFIEWCASYEITPDECPADDPDALQTAGTKAFMSGPSIEPVRDNAFAFSTVTFNHSAGDPISCAAKSCVTEAMNGLIQLGGWRAAVRWYRSAMKAYAAAESVEAFAAAVESIGAAEAGIVAAGAGVGLASYLLTSCILQHMGYDG